MHSLSIGNAYKITYPDLKFAYKLRGLYTETFAVKEYTYFTFLLLEFPLCTGGQGLQIIELPEKQGSRGGYIQLLSLG